MNKFHRTRNLLGEDLYQDLISKKVLLFGVGGVGSASLESLVRIGFKEISIVDFARVDPTNLNRQIFTNEENIGAYKCLAIIDRMKKINPQVKINYFIKKVMHDLSIFEIDKYDYVIDAIDTTTAKLNIIEYCKKNDIKIISSMGAGNRIDLSRVRVMDIYDTYNDPLARVIRRELRKRGVDSLKVVFSDEDELKKSRFNEKTSNTSPFSISYIPPVFGYMMVSELVKDFMKG